MADPTGKLKSRRVPDDNPVVTLIAQPQLVAQAIEVALRSRGLDVAVVPGDGRVESSRVTDVLLLVDDLARPDAVRRAHSWIARSACPVLVLTSRGPDLAWGALLAAGAADVLDAATGLDEVEAAIRRKGTPRRQSSLRQRARLVRQWQRTAHVHSEVMAEPIRDREVNRTVTT